MCAQCASPEEDATATPERRIQAMIAPAAATAAPREIGLAQRVATRPGQPLPGSARRFFEPRLGHDLERVRVHTDGEAAHAARGIGARAYTLGNDIVFAAGAYDPDRDTGRRLLAHELVHVLQQARGAPVRVRAKLEVEDPRGALPGTPPRENWEDVRDYVRALSSSFDVSRGGAVTPVATDTCKAPVRTTDRCLCDLHAATADWKIKIDDADWPHTEEANHRVTLHSTRSQVEFGAWGGGAQAGTRIALSNPRALGHELCGHAWLMESGTHPTGPPLVFVGGQLMGRPSHDPTVAIENTVAGEMTPGAPQRGSFADPHHGESFARITVSGFARNESDPRTLSSDMQARLVRAKDGMNTAADMRADVVGHGDHVGTASANAQVSRARARAVRNHLIRLGVSAGKFMVVEGHGDSECPAGPADNPDCRKAEVFMFTFQGASLRNP
jgi:hypothetical protein